MVTDEADANSIQPLFSEEEIYDFISTFYYRQYSLFTNSSKTLYKILILKLKHQYIMVFILYKRFWKLGFHLRVLITFCTKLFTVPNGQSIRVCFLTLVDEEFSFSLERPLLQPLLVNFFYRYLRWNLLFCSMDSFCAGCEEMRWVTLPYEPLSSSPEAIVNWAASTFKEGVDLTWPSVRTSAILWATVVTFLF